MKILIIFLSVFAALSASNQDDKPFETKTQSGQNVYQPVVSAVDVQKEMRVQKDDMNASLKQDSKEKQPDTHKGH